MAEPPLSRAAEKTTFICPAPAIDASGLAGALGAVEAAAGYEGSEEPDTPAAFSADTRKL
jgi:hypothetical protein